MTRIYAIAALLGILAVWFYREQRLAEERGALKAQLATLDSSRVRFQDSILSYKASQKRDSAIIASLTAQKEGLVTEAARRGQVAANGLLSANQAILALRGSLDSISRLKLDTIQATLDSTAAWGMAERAARVLGDSLNGILTQRLARAERLLYASDSLVQRQAVMLKALAPKRPFPVTVGCALGPTVSAGGFSYAGVSCGLVLRFR